MNKVCYFVLMGIFSILFGGCGTSENIKTIDATTFKAEVTGTGVQLLDVRTPGEFAEGHIPEAVNANVNDPNFVEVASGQLDKSRPVYVYCRSGKRSMKAASVLAGEGFVPLNLKGGILAWIDAGYPIVTE